MFDLWNCGEAGPPRRLIGMSFQLGIPWQVALQQSLPPLSQPKPLCNDKAWSVEQFSADGTCLTDSVSQNSPQSNAGRTEAGTNLLILLAYKNPGAKPRYPEV
jgi:hypothetical protein